VPRLARGSRCAQPATSPGLCKRLRNGESHILRSETNAILENYMILLTLDKSVGAHLYGDLDHPSEHEPPEDLARLPAQAPHAQDHHKLPRKVREREPGAPQQGLLGIRSRHNVVCE